MAQSRSEFSNDLENRSRTFAIGLCGVTGNDRSTLNRMLLMTQGRMRRYAIQEESSTEMPDMVLVNIDDRVSVQEWCQRYLDKETNKRKCPTIAVGREKPDDCKLKFLQLPFFASRVLRALDEVTVKELKFVPELTISDNSQEIEEVSKKTAIHRNLSSVEIENLVESEPQSETSINRKKVLVVDDSLPVRRALEIKLKMMQYDVEMATNGADALSLVEANKFDSVFLDVVMPGMDGYEVCRKIKRGKTTRHIPVIMLTSRSSPFDKVKGKLAGCDTYLTKPIEHKEFQQIVSDLLDG